ncbi:TIGR04222 domain-containing membrane protein [Streptomyces lunaelactis]|uniref:TIGR04222 domain-containing membrane protein n=1 Tax=Streptomyces lunaelactis TaxID=1535768 RepID=A0A2R4T9W9_9ACTN|nr:TIGR04222 domain-containing membrane protein [Streptomyces lunaelactis]AVZ75928.1 TIGR04222 domain-containing membrane protein [Streptomyces lunaelactis]NUK86654.1 TIGR04222 domain-containing membrane protein [Streptomyces lunaelactis]NUL06734.1 TIGR04222 domain-containing membrane protein [Streptomyces lunaelactis]
MFWVLFLLAAWTAAGISCARLCHAAVQAARPAPEGQGGKRELSLYEAAFLAGGPHRVMELTLVSMHRRRRLLLAHTGWATVVDPEGEDDLERSVIGAIGPAGQARIAAVRTAASAADAVRALADRLVSAGLAVPDTARSHVASAVRGVQGAAAATVALAATALLMLPQEQGATAPVLAWFALPLVLTLGCLAIARIEVHPYSRWASPDGQRLLGSLSPESDGDERAFLTAVAVRGVGAVDDPDLRAALTGGRTAHRSH